MSKNPSNPFCDTDFSKYLDVSKMFDFQKMFDGYKVPNVDVEAMMASQRKNIETVASANQKAFESMQSYVRRQSELARQSFEATASLVQAIMAAPTPEEKVAKQVEATKATIESCVSNLKELSDVLSQTQMQTIKAVSDRVCENMDEMKGIIKTCACKTE